ncbi:15567_t:CDS:2 [Dentiscutata erythropus]|uniref:15567_t:CDS:1 n=1 Tax=Dentiscutata erythropus TaxID=1348616 RepID=A0A9N9DCG0_9GLOM|nr:15567_t:CDS:2 [Dentiscutata erythropus]
MNFIDKIIKEFKVQLYDYSEFKNVKLIVEDGFCRMIKAYWHNFGLTVALKSLKLDELDRQIAIAKELRVLSTIMKYFHPNINQFYGVAKDSSNDQYFLIFQYANDVMGSGLHQSYTSSENVQSNVLPISIVRKNVSISCNGCRELKIKCQYIDNDGCRRCAEKKLICISDLQKRRVPKKSKKTYEKPLKLTQVPDLFSERSESLERYFLECNVKSYDYSQFSDIRFIESGRFATVYSTTFQERTVALKSLNKNLRIDEGIIRIFVSELKSLSNIDNPNVVKFYGISRDPKLGNFIMVLQYANGGTLRDYLHAKQNNGLYKITWVEIIQIAKEITNGLDNLHLNGIIHRGLHSKNVLINDERVLISDFGLAKQLDYSNSNTQEMITYVDPLYFLYEKSFKHNEKSDIYSLGVLFWELTSGTPLFYNLSFTDKMLKIANHGREEIITNTPQDYSILYKSCWSSDQKKRPTLKEVSIVLEKLSTETDVEFIVSQIVQITETDDVDKKYSENNQQNPLKYQG